MAACYADDVRFSDPVFPDLRGESARNLWRMLCGRAKDLEISYSVASAEGNRAVVDWEARYTFSTGRRVHNLIRATLRIESGKIVEHDDRFSFWRWSAQALGVAGLFLGWSPLVKNKVRAQAAKNLARFTS